MRRPTRDAGEVQGSAGDAGMAQGDWDQWRMPRGSLRPAGSQGGPRTVAAAPNTPALGPQPDKFSLTILM